MLVGQMVLCALANTFQHCKKKATTLGEVIFAK
jgi:cell division control protein 6